MTLYAADVMDLAKPVEKKKRKVLATPPDSETSEVAPPVKEKKPRTEAQIAALERAKEARKQKREEAKRIAEEAAKKEAEERQVMEQKAKQEQEKKEQRKEKRRLAAQKRKMDRQLHQDIEEAVLQVQSEKPKSTEDMIVPEPPKPKVKRQRLRRQPEDPPLWFQKYMEGVKREQGEKKPVKQIQQEAQELAKEKWEDGLVRDRLTNEVDAHMNRMYSMIFGRR